MKKIVIIILALIGFSACTEKMMIETPEGEQLVGISGSITDEYKHQEIIISRTTPFYGGEPAMISNATVFVVDNGTDTIWFEETDKNGYYHSVETFAGEPNHKYYLSVDFSDINGHHHFYSQSTMNENVEVVDSIIVKKLIFNAIELKDYLGVYPYFQTLDDPDIFYMARVKINNEDVGGDTLTKCELFNAMGYSGIYFNGQYMVSIAGEFPVGALNQKDSLQVLHRGDTVTLDLWSIPLGYAGYITNIASSTGSNPMMGTPSNVTTNIYPEGEAVGYFHASSLRQCSVIY